MPDMNENAETQQEYFGVHTDNKETLQNALKRIEELKNQNKKLKEKNAELKEKVEGYEKIRDKLIAMGFPTFMSCKEYVAQIEKMKCCANCKYKDCNKTSQYQTCWYCKNKNKWELKE